MPRPTNVDTLDDVKTWITDHDARIDVYWENQHSLNDRVDKKFNSLNIRLTAVEKRVVFVAGIAAAVGSGVGVGVLQLFAVGVTP